MAGLNYKPDGQTIKDFMTDESRVRLLRGPVGSGKSTACCIELFRMAMEQEPGADGIKRTRMGVVRNTNPQLRMTTIKTWQEWFPENVFGKFRWAPPFTHHIRLGDIDCEVIFLALDTDKDIRKLLSTEFTAIWINEAREVPKPIIDACSMRIDRYPSMKDGGAGATHPGLILDTNSPDDEHWWPIMAGDVPIPDHFSEDQRKAHETPSNWKFFTQPPAMLAKFDKAGRMTSIEINPNRDNAKFIKPAYYTEMIGGKSQGWINVYVLNKYDSVFEGRPVYSSFSRPVHVASEFIKPIDGLTIFVGFDFGLTPAAVFGQKIRTRWIILRELVCTDMGTVRFAQQVRETILEHFPDHEFRFTGDPAGDQRAQTDESTPLQILNAADIQTQVAYTNDPQIRISAVDDKMRQMEDGQPCYLIDPRCKNLIAAKEGGYHYKDKTDEPDKGRFSHVSDAEQYMMLGAGEGRNLIRRAQNVAPSVKGRTFSPHARRQRPGGGFRPGMRR